MKLDNVEALNGHLEDIQFEDIFDLTEIQQLQNLFSDTNGVASIITKPDGIPITEPSNFCNLCSVIRKTERGLANCYKSASIIGQINQSTPTFKPCMCVGLMDVSASIYIKGKHIGNWIIGQVCNEALDEKSLIKYAEEIGAEKEDLINALKEVPVISKKQLEKISNLLFAFVNQLSEKAYINWQHKKHIAELQEKTALLQESEYFFKATQKAAMVGSFKVDFNTYSWASSEVFDMIHGINTGYSRSIQNWLDLVHPEDRNMMNNFMRNEIKLKNKSFNKEYRIIRRSDNKTRWVLGLGTVGFNEKGKINSFTCTIQDITKSKISEILIQEKNIEIKAQNEEYKKINEELQSANKYLEESEGTYRMLFDSINDAVFIIEISNETKQVRFTKVNDIACQLLGYTMEELLSKSPIDINSDRTKPLVTTSINRVIQNGHLIMEVEYLTKYGRTVPAEISSKIFQQNGKTFIHTIVRDISNRKKSEKELIKAKEKAEESDLLKTAFLQNMSHEIRTPMNAILGFSDLLVRNYGNKDKLKLYTNILTQSCSDLLDIIDDILNIAKIETGLLQVSIENCNLNLFLRDLELFFSEHQNKLQKKHIKFNLSTCSNLENSIILTDKVKLKQIFVNLISNAFKYTDQGSIEGGCQLDKDNNLLFYVTDTGIGIPHEKQRVIFERFVQVEPSSNRLFGGNGLGLSITKGLIELLDGRIWLESVVGKGSTFYFTLPYQKSPKPNSQFQIIEQE